MSFHGTVECQKLNKPCSKKKHDNACCYRFTAQSKSKHF